MTIREIAEVWGISVQNLNARVKKLFPECIRKGKQTSLSEEQVAILNNDLRMSGKTIAQFAKTNLNDNIQVTSNELPATKQDMLAVIAKANEYLGILLEDARKEADNLRIELDRDREWYSVKRVLIETGKEYPWRPLKEYSIENGYEVKKSFDANYGECNTYHIDVWYAVYGLEL